MAGLRRALTALRSAVYLGRPLRMAHASIPVLVVSGSEDPNVPEQMRQLGADGYVSKPFIGSE